jgi:large subunit ribosomal protein L29
MDIDKVRELTDNELTEELVKQRRHLYDLRFQLATRQLTDYSQLTGARRTIARILTVATEREQTGAGPVPSSRPDKSERTSGRRLGVRRRASDAPDRGDNDDNEADKAATAAAAPAKRSRRRSGATE